MITEFKTEIVSSNKVNKVVTIVFLILYVISIFYVFLYDKDSQNIYLKYLALAVYLSGIYFLFGKSFIKPKKIGVLKLSTEKIEFEENGETKNIPLNELENVYLNYMDYGSWTTHSIYGNKNHIIITDKSGNRYNFEILIRNKDSKDELKSVLNSSEYYEKFNLTKAPNSRTNF
ncbi:conserved hypothetical protein [Formosa agariphila KMM 3901]|uniref:Uncharacterized protein n=1 Tax=Formosa agariphila (strain DSM 15362 / KCTC 12365 / LMG 23005 / KMM 3901 / M-2Alg 35-1) TaxID=1347342 RepID=T2KQ35_FORAG|nr:hypothetical protein [Formosa agariphila]CDF80942.1 conserved hypothetical protein [Formosa agariphila KMM 3901]